MWKILKHAGQAHHRRLIATFSLVGLDNLLLLVYPAFGGWVINAVMGGNVWQVTLCGVMVLLVWIIGVAHRIAGTRTSAQTYTEIAVPVVLEQRKREVPHSAITARVALSHEFVSFFEGYLPIAATSLVSIFDACMILLVLESWVDVSAVTILTLFLWLLPRSTTISKNLCFRLDDRLERDNHLIRDGNEYQLYRYYGWAAKLRVLIPNRGALGYLSIGIVMSVLFGFTSIHMTLKGYNNAGHIYSVSTYLWMFVMSLDDVPRLVEQYSNLKDIGQHIELSEKNNLPKAV